MYVKTTARKTKSGPVRYLHLAHNEWDPVAGRSVPKILYGIGREDQLDRDAVKRLVGSLARLLDPADALAAAAGAELAFQDSRPHPPVAGHGQQLPAQAQPPSWNPEAAAAARGPRRPGD